MSTLDTITIPPGRVYGYSDATISVNGDVVAESGTSPVCVGPAPVISTHPWWMDERPNRRQRRAMRAQRRRTK